MATKPTTVPTFAEDTTDGVDAIEPSAGKKSTGWLPNERPPAEYLNWLQRTYGEWLQYLSDGAFSGTATFANGLSAAANQHISVSGTGRFKHGDQILNLSPFSAQRDGNWAIGSGVLLGSLGYIISTAAGDVLVPIPLVVGQRIKSVVFARYGDGAADLSTVVVNKMTAGGAVTDITAAPVSVTNPAASWADTTVDVTDTTATDGDVFWIAFSANAANIRIGSIRVTYDWP